MMIVGRLIKLIPLNTWQILLQKPKLKIKSFLPLKSHKLTVSGWATIGLLKTKQNKQTKKTPFCVTGLVTTASISWHESQLSVEIRY